MISRILKNIDSAKDDIRYYESLSTQTNDETEIEEYNSLIFMREQELERLEDELSEHATSVNLQVALA